MIADHQKVQTVTRLKKAYSALSQTTARAIADNGPIETWTIEKNKTKEFVEQYLLPYLSVGKICGYTDRTGACNLSYEQNNKRITVDNKFYIFYLQDGSAIASVVNNADNVTMLIDINGIKGPNKMDRDNFIYMYFPTTVGKFLPMCQGKSRETMISKGYCGADLIMMDGWQISKDYPW